MKRRLLSIITLLALCIGSNTVSGFAAETAEKTFTVPVTCDCILSASIASDSKPGQVDVIISLDQTELLPGLNALAFEVTYDKDAFELINIDTAQSEWAGMEYSFSESFNVYPYRCGWVRDQMEPYKGTGKMVRLTFALKEGVVPGSKHEFGIVNTEGGYYSLVDQKPVLNKAVFNTVGCEYSHFGYGDVDRNGKVDFADALYLKRYIAGWTGYQNIDRAVADLNNNGNVELADLLILEKHIAGWKDYCSLPMNVQ